jgi:hypothetical protein
MFELTTYPTEQVNPLDSAWQPHKGENNLMEALEAKPRLTPEEEMEEHRLKKLKLRLKDQMNAMISRNRAQNVA